MDVDTLLRDVQIDLTDGQDLALAVQLVSDALSRRVRRVRVTLEKLEGYAAGEGNDELARRVEQLAERTAAFEQDMRALADRISSLADQYEHEVQALADNVRERFRDLEEQ